jgi:superfamily II DNA or RNA helicase
MSSAVFSPGSLVSARGREWVVQPPIEEDLLYLRPLGGTDQDIQVLIPSLEGGVSQATFPPLDVSKPGNAESARLLRDALTLKLQSGAGPFRSFGHIAVEPRAYQLVPLLMALKLPVIRLLIADDVGIGKTIEAGLIVRELLDRAEIDRFAVLCPPHLVEQWIRELADRFHITAVGLTSRSAAQIEGQVPRGLSLFDHHKVVVVSLDYIKSQSHRDHFVSHAPPMIVVDEAHTCTLQGQGRQMRFQLLERLAANPDRHMVLLTATPHSGKEEGFHNLLSLLSPEFGSLAEHTSAEDPIRINLAKHFVQRRRKDIEEWQDSSIFPRRMTSERTYQLTGKWGAFFERVKDYCVQMGQRAEETKGEKARMIWYATLALLRCVSSSPAAAMSALSTRLDGTQDNLEDSAEDDRLMDGIAEEMGSNDQEPSAVTEDSEELKALILEAETLRGLKGDPKLAELFKLLKELSAEGFKPVVFCRYIATARYVAEYAAKEFPSHRVEAITGEYTPEEREERISLLFDEEKPILIATDCLSEGINLQQGFTAVVHYDLAWNPTRHEQREGRVDRFGQRASEVRCCTIYGQDNPVDGIVLQVILRKAEAIRKELGVLVPMPEDRGKIQQAMIKATLLRKGPDKTQQGYLDFEELQPLQAEWKDAMEKAKVNRTIFAQRRLKPSEVLPEWNKQAKALGTSDKVSSFVQTACQRLGSPLEPGKNGSHKLLPTPFIPMIRERLKSVGIDKPLAVDFTFPSTVGARFVHRSHPLVETLADILLEGALSGDMPIASRSGAVITEQVSEVTSFYLVRIRHQMDFKKKSGQHQLMAEEALLVGLVGLNPKEWMPEETVESLLERVKPRGNITQEAASRAVTNAMERFGARAELVETLALQRAMTLQEDHERVREASAERAGSWVVSPCLPVDLIGVFVLLPEGL